MAKFPLTESARAMNEFLQRLKERKLVQWTVAYVAAAFALLQGIDIVAQRFGWPEQTMRFVIIALSVGLFVTLVLAWYHGERGAQRVTGTELLILALLLAIGGGFLWRFAGAVHRADREARTPSSRAVAATIPEKSIAVLPFENLSDDKENAYFVEGIQDEILTRLAKIARLKVISRTSTMRYESKPDNLREIAQQLGVSPPRWSVTVSTCVVVIIGRNGPKQGCTARSSISSKRSTSTRRARAPGRA